MDYWGTVDAYCKPTWDGEGDDEGGGGPWDRVTLEGIKFDVKRNRGKGAEVRAREGDFPFHFFWKSTFMIIRCVYFIFSVGIASFVNATTSLALPHLLQGLSL